MTLSAFQAYIDTTMKSAQAIFVDHFYWKQPFYADLESEPSNSLIVLWQHRNRSNMFATIGPKTEARFFSIKLLYRNHLAASILLVNPRIP